MEIEVKFLVRNAGSVTQRLEALGARLTHPEVYERNLRFDRPDGALTRSFQILRLRQDTRVRLTYKGKGFAVGEVGAREEIEFEADDFDAARAFLEALGFVVRMVYEKYRTTYEWDAVEIVLDRTPLGHFIEIEGPDEAAIKSAAASLGLDWEARCMLSYGALFETAKAAGGFTLRDMTFENFERRPVTPDMLGLKPGDG